METENSIAARREARRRRILANSENRLKRITGDIDFLPKTNVSDQDIGENDSNPMIQTSGWSRKRSCDNDNLVVETNVEPEIDRTSIGFTSHQEKLLVIILSIVVFTFFKTNYAYLFGEVSQVISLEALCFISNVSHDFNDTCLKVQIKHNFLITESVASDCYN